MDVKGKSAFEVSSLLQGPNETFVTVQVVVEHHLHFGVLIFLLIFMGHS